MEPAKTEEGRFSDRTINELVRACIEMGRVKTGALIVIEQTTPLLEYVRSGIEIDAIVSSQLLINIFEKNTPLHDGAVIVRGNRIVSATSYLPITSSQLDKNLGTRHRAGVGISEETDALTLIVSEETGQLSYSYKGNLWSNVTPEQLRGALVRLQNKLSQEEAARNAARSAFGGISEFGRKTLRRTIPGGFAGPDKNSAYSALFETDDILEAGDLPESGKAPGTGEPQKTMDAKKEGGAHD
jgi:diadenylate cyclase